MALFISHFHFSVDEFDKLTPVQAYRTLNKKQELEQTQYLFWSEQFRFNNFLTLTAPYVDPKRIRNIKKPSDLYPLAHDKKEYSVKEIEYLSRKLTPKEREIIRRL